MKIGILGDGQLSRMLLYSIYKLGIDTFVFGTSEDSSAISISKKYLIGNFNNPSFLGEIDNSKCDFLILESDFLDFRLIKEYITKTPIYPSIDSVVYLSNKWNAYSLCKQLDINAPLSYLLSSVDMDKLHNSKYIIKKVTGGYDGGGIYLVDSKSKLNNFLSIHSKNLNEYMIQEFLEFDKEISVMVSISKSYFKILPITETFQQNGMFYRSLTYRSLTENLYENIYKIVKKIISNVSIIGVFTVEFFLKNDELYVNEFALRVHNSYHWTDLLQLNQFDIHIRSILNIPISNECISISNKKTYICYNIISKKQLSNLDNFYEKIFEFDNTVNIYQKSLKPNRKVGHMALSIDTNKVNDILPYIDNYINKF